MFFAGALGFVAYGGINALALLCIKATAVFTWKEDFDEPSVQLKVGVGLAETDDRPTTASPPKNAARSSGRSFVRIPTALR